MVGRYHVSNHDCFWGIDIDAGPIPAGLMRIFFYRLIRLISEISIELKPMGQLQYRSLVFWGERY